MGLRITTSEASRRVINLVYEGLAPAPPFDVPSLFLGRGVAINTINIARCPLPGNLLLTLEPVDSENRGLVTQRIPVRNGQLIVPKGDYDITLSLIPNGCSTAAALAAAELCTPISRGEMEIYWSQISELYRQDPREQGAICPILRLATLGAGVTATGMTVVAPVSGIPRFICNMSAGAAGQLSIRRGPVVETVALAALGSWTSNQPIVHGQELSFTLRNTAAGNINVDVDMVLEQV